jgi:ParB-like chromosome segregation protein Spo0J
VENNKILPVEMKTIKTSGIEFVSINKLKFNPTAVCNELTINNYEEFKKQLSETGISKPLLVERITNKVLSGNLLLLIALELGIKNLPVIYLDHNSKKNQATRSVA